MQTLNTRFVAPVAALAALLPTVFPDFVRAEEKAAAPKAQVRQLIARDLTPLPAAGESEVIMFTVEYPPGGASTAHRHDAHVLVYVLEGHIQMQVAGKPAVTLGPGETFYESPQDLHAVSANASKTEPAKFVVTMVKGKGAPASRPADPDASRAGQP